MICDNLKNAGKYLAVWPMLREAFAFLGTLTEETPAGRYEIDGDHFVNVFSYESKPRSEGLFEDHRVYADVHFIVSGCECIDLTDVGKVAVEEDKYETEDAALGRTESGYSTLELHEGDFAVIFPGEAHRPGIMTGDRGETVRKAVVKIKAKQF